MNVHVENRGGPTTGRRDSFAKLQDDFGTSMRQAWPYSLLEALAPTRKTLVTARPVPRSSVERISPTASAGCADRAREVLPRRAPGKGRRQVQHDAAHRALDPDGELEQPLPQRGDLGVRAGRAARAALELLEQDVGGQSQQDAELVGQKLRAAGPVHLQPVMQLFEPVLHVAPLAVDLLVDRPGRAGQVGHDEPGIVLGVAAGMPDHLGLDDDPPLALPRFGRVPRLPVEVLRPAGGSRAHPGLAIKRRARFSNRALLAMATTYSTAWASRNAII